MLNLGTRPLRPRYDHAVLSFFLASVCACRDPTSVTGDTRARKDGLKARARVADRSLVMPEQNRPRKTLVLRGVILQQELFSTEGTVSKTNGDGMAGWTGIWAARVNSKLQLLREKLKQPRNFPFMAQEILYGNRSSSRGWTRMPAANLPCLS